MRSSLTRCKFVADHQDLATLQLRPRYVLATSIKFSTRPYHASCTSIPRPRRLHCVSYHVVAVPNTSLVGSYQVHTKFELRPPRFIFVLIVPYPQLLFKSYRNRNMNREVLLQLALLQGHHALLGAQAALVLFHRWRNRRTRPCWVRPWLSAEIRLQYGHYDRLLAEFEDRGPAVILQFHSNATRNVVRPSFSYCNFKLFRNLSDS